MNIPLLIILKDFILFCEEHEIEEPTKKDIHNYVTSNHFNFLNESEPDFDVLSFESAIENLIIDIFKNKLIIANKNKEELKKEKHKFYELIALFKPEASESAQESTTKLLQNDKIKIANVQDWGIKKLAYPCRGYEQGFYIYYELLIEKESAAEIEKEIHKTLESNNDILKILLVPTKSGIQ